MPIRDKTFAVARALTVLLLPARLTYVRPLEISFFVEQQGVVQLFVGKRFAACFARVGAGLNFPIGHENGLNKHCILATVLLRETLQLQS